jgi:hypothetical protein
MHARMHEPQSNAGVMLYDDDQYIDCADYASSCASYFCPACAYSGKCDTTCQFSGVAPVEFHGVAPGAKMMVYGAWGKGVEWSALYLVFDTDLPLLLISKSPNPQISESNKMPATPSRGCISRPPTPSPTKCSSPPIKPARGLSPTAGAPSTSRLPSPSTSPGRSRSTPWSTSTTTSWLSSPPATSKV